MSEKQKGKAIVSTNEYTHSSEGGTSKRKTLRGVLASTIELLAYSPTAYKLIYEEEWGMPLLQQLSSEKTCIDIIGAKGFKEIHRWNVDSKPLIFLLTIFVSYNSLYTRRTKEKGGYQYTSVLDDLNKILIRNIDGTTSKTDSIEQNGSQLVEDLYLNQLLKSTIDKLDLSKDNEFIEIMDYMKNSLSLFYTDFSLINKMVESSDLNEYLKLLRNRSWGNKPRVRFERYIQLNEIMHDLNNTDIQIMKTVVEELFKFESSEEYGEKIKANNQWANSYQIKNLLKIKQREDMDPIKNMVTKLSENDQRMVKKINERFLLK